MKKLMICLAMAGLMPWLAANAQTINPGSTPDTASVNFVQSAASGGMIEVAASKQAIAKSKNQQVIAFARQMVTDHSKANNELMRLARSKSIMLPEAPAPGSMLIQSTDPDFDKYYVRKMLKDHQQTVALFERASASLPDTTLRAFAANTLPTLKAHLAHIEAIAQKMNISTP